jgi:hypothetical protein
MAVAPAWSLMKFAMILRISCSLGFFDVPCRRPGARTR